MFRDDLIGSQKMEMTYAEDSEKRVYRAINNSTKTPHQSDG